MKRSEIRQAQTRALEFFEKASITLTDEERARIEVADFGLNDLANQGLEILTYVNTERCCAKELVLFPNQACPEHMHPPVGADPGKEETFRCRWGEVFLYVDGPPSETISAELPSEWCRVRKEVHLRPGDQYTLTPGTKHWFKAGSQGAVVSEFSTRSRDEADVFTDPNVVRLPEIEED
ncbi:MAG: D-lyxose/D-mannose family sugar isomerase [Armatimonadetes bacterium]|nr:D-lyxose/D-mannose family sugar isomerase [Armatimonadota bacterium]